MAEADDIFGAALKEQTPDEAFNEAAGVDAGSAGSPLEKALKEQTGDVVTVKTPTGDVRFDRQGRPALTAEEYANRSVNLKDNDFKQWLLGNVASWAGGGGKMVDELRGADAAMKTGVQALGAGSPTDAWDAAKHAYVQTRNRTRKDVADVQRKFPVAGVVGAMTPYLVAPNAATAGGRIALGSASAGLDELGGSTSEGLGDIASDILKAGAGGALASGVGEGLFGGLRWAGGKALEQAKGATGYIEGLLAKGSGKGVNSELGVLRNVIGQENTVAKNAITVVNNPHLYEPAEVQAAEQFLSSPDGKELLRRSAVNSLDLGGMLANKEDAARKSLAQAVAASDPALLKAQAAQMSSPGVVAKDLSQKALRTFGPRAALGVAGGVAGGLAEALGTDSHEWKGGAGGGFAAGWMSAPGVQQFVRNAARSPAVQSAANQMAGRLFEGVANVGSAAARSAAPALQQNARQNAYDRLMNIFGVTPKSPEQASDEAFLLSQTDSRMQPE